MVSRNQAIALGLALIGLAFSSVAASPWREILGPAQGAVPPPAEGKVVWRGDLAAAMAEAQRFNRPMFVTMRCIPCKQCADFDKEVLEGGPDLDPVLLQFVTVRLVTATAIDLRIFPIEGYQDLDLSWWGWLLSPEGRIYGIYGGRDQVSDATRISKASLIATLNRVLAHHYDPRRAQWNADGPAPDLNGSFQGVRGLPGYKSYEAQASAGFGKQECIHCHQVNDILRQPALDAKTFDKRRDVQVWPLPENVGLAIDRDDGLLVTGVKPGSPAERAGVKPGDVLGTAGDRRLYGQADFRGVLHRGPRDAGEVEVAWLRGKEVMSGKLALASGWRETDLGWRMSISQGHIGAYPGFFPLAVNPGRRQQMGIPEDGMAIQTFMGSNTNSAAYRAGLRSQSLLTAVDGVSTNLAGRPFLVWFRQRYDPGDRVTLTLRTTSGTTNVAYTMPGHE